MPRISATLFTLALLLTGTFPSANADEFKPIPKDLSTKSVFGLDKIWEVLLTIPAKEYETMQPIGGFGGQPRKLEKEDPAREVHRNHFGADLPWAKATVSIDGQTFEGVGIRYKGNGTIGDTARTIKKSFKVDLDRFGGDGTFHGLKTLNLHCDVTDPSRYRETLAYAMYRSAGVPASKTAFVEVRLTVPGKYDKELLGVYTLVEQVNKPFLKEQFKSDKGLLMKPEGLRDFVFRGDDWEQYKMFYVCKRDATPEESKRMIAFAKLVDKADDTTFRKEIGSYLEIDNYLRFLAATAFLANTDSFFGLGHNYYMYLHPETKKISFMPWDLDRAFANFGNANQNMDLSMVHPYGGAHRLTDRLLAHPETAAKYQALLKVLAEGAFAKERFLKDHEALEKGTKELLARDVKAAAARKETAGFSMFGQPPALTTFIEKRTDSLNAQLNGKSKGFIPDAFGGFGPPGGGRFGRPGGLGGFDRPGELIPAPLQDQLMLNAEQKKQLADLQKEMDAKLNKLLTDEQRKQFKEFRDRGPGVFGPPGGFGPGQPRNQNP
jgi:spore coat protein H